MDRKVSNAGSSYIVKMSSGSEDIGDIVVTQTYPEKEDPVHNFYRVSTHDKMFNRSSSCVLMLPKHIVGFSLILEVVKQLDFRTMRRNNEV